MYNIIELEIKRDKAIADKNKYDQNISSLLSQMTYEIGNGIDMNYNYAQLKMLLVQVDKMSKELASNVLKADFCKSQITDLNSKITYTRY